MPYLVVDNGRPNRLSGRPRVSFVAAVLLARRRGADLALVVDAVAALHAHDEEQEAGRAEHQAGLLIGSSLSARIYIPPQESHQRPSNSKTRRMRTVWVGKPVSFAPFEDP